MSSQAGAEFEACRIALPKVEERSPDQLGLSGHHCCLQNFGWLRSL